MTYMLFRTISELIDLGQNDFALLSVTSMLGIITAAASVLISYALTTRNAAKFLEARLRLPSDAVFWTGDRRFREHSWHRL